MQKTDSRVVGQFSEPDKSCFLILFLKALNDRIVLYESGMDFHSFGAVNCSDLRPYVEEFPLPNSRKQGCTQTCYKSTSRKL